MESRVQHYNESSTHLSDSPCDEEVHVLRIGRDSRLDGVEATEVRGAVDDDALHRHKEATTRKIIVQRTSVNRFYTPVETDWTV